MQGGHNPNFTSKQLLDRLYVVISLDAVFTRHPELEQGHKRRDIRHPEDKDHLNRESFDANKLIVSGVHLAEPYARAEAALAEASFNIDLPLRICGLYWGPHASGWQQQIPRCYA